MCGIAGWIDYNHQIQTQAIVAEDMAHTLVNRGPDEGGYYKDANAWLIHRRLAVVDPENGKQPMSLTAGRSTYHMVYNGELYNTGDLKTELVSLGHEFREQSDTEVLLHAYTQWGVDCLQRLNGIYAFAVWNEEKQELFLARDRMGVKPLFFYCLDGGIVFGSQIKTLLAHPEIKPEVDADGLRELWFMGPGRTGGQGIFKGICELKPAEYAILNRDGLKIDRYWSLEASEHTDSFEKTIETTHDLVEDAIHRQLVSDVPLCCFLSGGLDSSIITKMASDSYKQQGRQLTTYSVDYQDNAKYFQKSIFQPNSDDVYIDMMVKDTGVNHRKVILDNNALADALPDAAIARDLPGMADVDSSLLLFCKEVKKDFTVALSGECADEIFGGYPWFHQPDLLNGNEFPWARSMAVRHQILKPGAITGGDDYVRQQYSDFVKRVPYLPGESEQNSRIRLMTMLNMQWFMQTLLDRKDRMSMECSLEVRVPFCDHRIAQYAYNIPWEMKAYEGREKGLLRMAVDGMLPHDIIWRKKSPYPKTHNPIFMKRMVDAVRFLSKDKTSILQELVDWNGVEQLIEHPNDLPSTWYGQLMGAPQILAYLLQVDVWAKQFGVKLV